MSSWQSFFNQLSHPQKTNSNSMKELICSCEKGSLSQTLDMKYLYSGSCSSKCFCAIIEQDRRDARTFYQSISLSQTKQITRDKDTITENNSLERLLGNFKTNND